MAQQKGDLDQAVAKQKGDLDRAVAELKGEIDRLDGKIEVQGRYTFLVLALIAALGLYNAAAPHLSQTKPDLPGAASSGVSLATPNAPTTGDESAAVAPWCAEPPLESAGVTQGVPERALELREHLVDLPCR